MLNALLFPINAAFYNCLDSECVRIVRLRKAVPIVLQFANSPTSPVLSTLHLSDAEIRIIDGRTVPLALINGRWYVIDTKPSLLRLQVAVAVPIDALGRYDWAAEPRLRVVIPADPLNGRPEPLGMEDATADPRVVALARRFNELLVTGEARPGPFSICRP